MAQAGLLLQPACKGLRQQPQALRALTVLRVRARPLQGPQQILLQMRKRQLMLAQPQQAPTMWRT